MFLLIVSLQIFWEWGEAEKRCDIFLFYVQKEPQKLFNSFLQCSTTIDFYL